jgi:NAD(P)-dependent dehydrogenase (short-subunit alcohol dehydrogenase family)
LSLGSLGASCPLNSGRNVYKAFSPTARRAGYSLREYPLFFPILVPIFQRLLISEDLVLVPRWTTMSRLTEKVAVVFGGSSGIGLATAQRFVEEGAYVYITGRRQVELDRAAAQIGQNVKAVRSDIQTLNDIREFYAVVAQDSRKVDALVVSSGFLERQVLAETTEENFDKSFGINTRGLLFAVQQGLPLLRDGGSIVLISSIAGFKGFPGHSSYSATKAAVRSFVRTWTAELATRRIRVNAISPGPIDTPMIDGQANSKEGVEQIRAYLAAAVPIGRLGRPEEVASAALFLASAESSFVGGIDLVVDGGLSAL